MLGTLRCTAKYKVRLKTATVSVDDLLQHFYILYKHKKKQIAPLQQLYIAIQPTIHSGCEWMTALEHGSLAAEAED